MTNPDPQFDLTGALPYDDGADAPTPQKSGPATLGAEFAYIGRALTLDSFASYVASYPFGTTPPDYVVLHHTAIPSTLAARYPSGAVWDANESGMSELQIQAKRVRQLDQLMHYYRDVLHWTKGPHLFIDDRWIYLFTPMNTVGIHAAQGNSYRDSRGRLHYSIGIEVIGYYERTRWPAAVARNVACAVVALQQTLKTFQLVDKPWAGGISAHRHYNKPQCPGAAIQPDYYLPLFRAAATPDAPHPLDAHWRVLETVTAGATIRAAPRTNAAVLGRLRAGDDWYGESIDGQAIYVPGFGSSNQWVRDSTMRCVWRGLLEKVKQ